ncbi:MAG TPA: NAD-dependent epimerase/dehydratase family protein [Oscillospiraceae bacterium]|nr:NAD-dependent epimerase/dehydratase family protein [Oscillospiraceae bacterium]HPS34940.1 NAD-dependent epimerase/dehydratase family protein [Oscillospiraceae bacterium]
MSRFVVTGATGHIGNNVARILCGVHQDVILVVRRNDDEAIAGLDAELAVGSFCDPDFLDRLLTADDIVIHCAGMIAITDEDAEEVMRVNFEGTKILADICVRKQVKKLVYISSVDAIYKPDANLPITEPSAFYPEKLEGIYGKSKAMATEYVLDLAKDGKLNASVAYPTAVIGPYDYKISNVGQVILDFITNKTLARVKGCYNFVDVRDVAQAVIQIAEKSEFGNGYILGGEVVSVTQLFEILSPLYGRNIPIKLPLWFVNAFSELGVLYYKVRSKKPVFSRFALKTLNSNCNYNITKAQTELGYSPRSAVETLTDSAKWLYENKAVKDRVTAKV